MVDDFVTGKQIAFPMSLLSDILPDVRFARAIYRPTFPKKWAVQTPKRLHGNEFGGHGNGGSGRLWDRMGGRQSGGQGIEEMKTSLADCHLFIATIMDPYLKKI